MIRSPMPHWQWRHIADNDRLVLELELAQAQVPVPDDIFVTAYKSKQLATKTGLQEAFNVEHTEQYYRFGELISSVLPELPEAVVFHMVVHAVAASFFHKSIGNKSWLFKTHMHVLPLTPLVSIETAQDKAVALVLENNNGFATIMLLSEHLEVPDNKPFSRYSLIKCNVNVLEPVVGEDAMALI